MLKGLTFATAVVVAVALPVGARAQTPAAPSATVLDTVTRATPVAAYGGLAVWSAYDPATNRYTLRAFRDGQATTLPVAARRAPFDADVGPGAGGRPVVVYSRCRSDAIRIEPFDGLPEWSEARGCDVHRLDPVSGSDRVLKAASSKVRSEFLPAIWGSRLAYFAVAEPRHGRRGLVARLYVADLRGRVRTRSFPAGTRGPLDRYGRQVVGGPSPTGIDLNGSAVVFSWSDLATCVPDDDDDSDSGVARAAEVWRQPLTGARRRLARSCTGYGVFSPFLDGSGAARWIVQPDSAARGATALAKTGGAAVALPAFTQAAALDGTSLIVSASTDTGPEQILALPAPPAG
jgi:hypothetical protein